MKKYNLIVVGGGLSGVAAAVAGAREGLSVLIIESTGSLGGALTDQLVFPFMPFYVNDSKTGEIKYLSDGLFRKMCLAQSEFENKTVPFEKEFKNNAAAINKQRSK